MKKLIVLAVFFATPALSQDLTHPLEMGLPDISYTRPDPAGNQLALENGLIAYVAEADQVPLVTMSAFIRGGLVSDESQGAAESLADALKNTGPLGTSSKYFNASRKQMTAEFVVAMHDEWTEITLNVPAEELDQGLSIFAGLLRHPAINVANITRAARGVAPEANDPGGESGAALYDGNLLERGRVVAREGPGLGIEVDWDHLATADFYSCVFFQGNSSITASVVQSHCPQLDARGDMK
jgi:hypothetical protein